MKIVMSLYPCPEDAPPELLGCADNALGLREWIENQGHELVTTTEREGEGLDELLQDAEVLVPTPFWPVYVTSEVMDKAPNLKLIVLAGVGSDNMDLAEAANCGIDVVEQTGSNVVSVAEHAVMQVLALVRNYIPAYLDVINGGWSIGEIAKKAYDLEGKTVGIYGAGQFGQLIASRLKPFSVEMLYYKRTPLSIAEEEHFGFRYTYLDDMLAQSDVIVIAAPLTPETEGLFDGEAISKMKKGSYIVNIARGAIADRDAVVEALKQGQLAGYAGDTWYPQPAPEDHPWRTMPNHAMTPHVSGTTLDAQRTYADGVRRCLEAFFNGEEIETIRQIVYGGEIQSGTYKAVAQQSN